METERGRAVGKTIAKAMAEVLSATPDEVVSRMDGCRDSLLDTAVDDEERDEIRRRIAESKLSILWESRDASRFMAVWQEMERLGYSSAEREASMLFYFLEFCALDGCDDVSCKDYLDRLERLAVSMPATARLHFESAHQKMREKLSANAA
jgi:hypothetical protein